MDSEFFLYFVRDLEMLGYCRFLLTIGLMLQFGYCKQVTTVTTCLLYCGFLIKIEIIDGSLVIFWLEGTVATLFSNL